MRLILLVLPLLAPACPAFVIFDPPQKLTPPVTYSLRRLHCGDRGAGVRDMGSSVRRVLAAHARGSKPDGASDHHGNSITTVVAGGISGVRHVEWKLRHNPDP